jgi:hypothetical protein
MVRRDRDRVAKEGAEDRAHALRREVWAHIIYLGMSDKRSEVATPPPPQTARGCPRCCGHLLHEGKPNAGQEVVGPQRAVAGRREPREHHRDRQLDQPHLIKRSRSMACWLGQVPPR